MGLSTSQTTYGFIGILAFAPFVPAATGVRMDSGWELIGSSLVLVLFLFLVFGCVSGFGVGFGFELVCRLLAVCSLVQRNLCVDC